MPRHGRGFSKTSIVTVIAALLLSVLISGCSEEPQARDPDMPDRTMDDPAPDREPAAEPVDDGGADSQAPEGQPDEDAAPAEGAEDGDEADARQSAADESEEGTGNVKTIIKIHTARGAMTAELYDEKMPITAGNFLLLIDRGYYQNMTFHRVVPDFVIQGGDPTGTGTGGPGWCIPLEKPGAIHHETGILSMARAQPLDSAGSQFFICLSNNQQVRALDSLGGGYAAFGRVIEGVDVAQRIDVGDGLEKIEIVSESEHADAARQASKDARIQ